MLILKYLFGLFPGIFISILFFKLDKEKSNRKNIICLLLFLLGCVGSYITYRVENKVGSYFPEMVDMNYFLVLMYSIFGVAIYEEGVKLFFIFFLTLKEKYSKIFSWIVISVICSMGYAIFENIVYYVMNGTIFTAIVRMFTAVPSHACFAVIMGECYSKYKDTNNFKYLFFSLIIPTILHSFYNVFLYKGSYIGFVINKIYFIILLMYCIKKVYRLKDV